MASNAQTSISPSVSADRRKRTLLGWPGSSPAAPLTTVDATPASAAGKVAPPSTGPASHYTQAGPEVLAEITASVTAFFGREVPILSVTRMETLSPTVNRWAGQGRVAMHGSHNVAGRRG